MLKKTNNLYESYADSEIISSTRTLSVLSALLFLFFGFLDYWALPSSFAEALTVRALVTLGLVLTYALTYTTFFIKRHSYILPAVFILSSMGIEYMIYLAEASDHASKVYFSGLILIIMTLFAWTYMKFFISFTLTAIIIGAYIFIEISTKDYAGSDFIILFTNVAFLFASAVIGFVARLMRDRYQRENFLLQQSLKEAYNEKAAEAKDNAYLANHDPLTDLPNRRYMTELLNESMQIAERNDKVLVIMFLDLNGFKQINDVYGHTAGDEVLVIVAKRLELAVRKGDHISRLGGDEYLLGLMIEKENLNEVEAMAAKFIDLISQPIKIEGLRIKVGASVGIAAYPIHGNNIDVLMDIADKRMYKAKRGKGNKPCFEEISYNKEKEPVVIFPGNAKRV